MRGGLSAGGEEDVRGLRPVPSVVDRVLKVWGGEPSAVLTKEKGKSGARG